MELFEYTGKANDFISLYDLDLVSLNTIKTGYINNNKLFGWRKRQPEPVPEEVSPEFGQEGVCGEALILVAGKTEKRIGKNVLAAKYLSVGDEVVSVCESSGKHCITKITKKQYVKTIQYGMKVSLVLVENVPCTRYCPILTTKGWMGADDITENDLVATYGGSYKGHYACGIPFWAAEKCEYMGTIVYTPPTNIVFVGLENESDNSVQTPASPIVLLTVEAESHTFVVLQNYGHGLIVADSSIC